MKKLLSAFLFLSAASPLLYAPLSGMYQEDEVHRQEEEQRRTEQEEREAQRRQEYYEHAKRSVREHLEQMRSGPERKPSTVEKVVAHIKDFFFNLVGSPEAAAESKANLARMYSQAGDLEGAAKHYKALSEKYPEFVDTADKVASDTHYMTSLIDKIEKGDMRPEQAAKSSVVGMFAEDVQRLEETVRNMQADNSLSSDMKKVARDFLDTAKRVEKEGLSKKEARKGFEISLDKTQYPETTHKKAYVDRWNKRITQEQKKLQDFKTSLEKTLEPLQKQMQERKKVLDALNLSKDPSQSELDRAVRKAFIKVHPDKLQNTQRDFTSSFSFLKDLGVGEEYSDEKLKSILKTGASKAEREQLANTASKLLNNKKEFVEQTKNSVERYDNLVQDKVLVEKLEDVLKGSKRIVDSKAQLNRDISAETVGKLRSLTDEWKSDIATLSDSLHAQSPARSAGSAVSQLVQEFSQSFNDIQKETSSEQKKQSSSSMPQAESGFQSA